MDPDRISAREDELVGRAIGRLDHSNIEIFGPLDPAQRIAIISFNIREGSSYLHPRFVTLLLNDLFGIQSRAGCSCAGPYGHRMLGLDEIKSAALRDRIHRGVLGLRPGWVRVNFHFLMSDEEAEFLIESIRFIADYGRFFLPLYTFDVRTGAWTYRGGCSCDPVTRASSSAVPGTAVGGRRAIETGSEFGLTEALELGGRERTAGPGAAESSVHAAPDTSVSGAGRSVDSHAARASIERRVAYLDEAARLAAELAESHPDLRIRSTLKDLIPFVYV
jgi:hypothetical protein